MRDMITDELGEIIDELLSRFKFIEVIANDSNNVNYISIKILIIKIQSYRKEPKLITIKAEKYNKKYEYPACDASCFLSSFKQSPIYLQYITNFTHSQNASLITKSLGLTLL